MPGVYMPEGPGSHPVPPEGADLGPGPDGESLSVEVRGGRVVLVARSEGGVRVWDPRDVGPEEVRREPALRAAYTRALGLGMIGED